MALLQIPCFLIQVISEGRGELVIVRRKREVMAAHQYLPCQYCLGFFSVDTLYVHNRKCIVRGKKSIEEIEEHKITRGKSVISASRCLLSPFISLQEDSEFLVEIVEGLKETKEHAGKKDFSLYNNLCSLSWSKISFHAMITS